MRAKEELSALFSDSWDGLFRDRVRELFWNEKASSEVGTLVQVVLRLVRTCLLHAHVHSVLIGELGELNLCGRLLGASVDVFHHL